MQFLGILPAGTGSDWECDMCDMLCAAGRKVLCVVSSHFVTIVTIWTTMPPTTRSSHGASSPTSKKGRKRTMSTVSTQSNPGSKKKTKGTGDEGRDKPIDKKQKGKGNR